MPGFATHVSHDLSRSRATERLKAFLDEVRRLHGDKVQNLRGEWRETTLDFAFTAYGMAVQGSMVVEEALVRVEGRLPLAAAFFRGQIEQTIRGELTRILAGEA